MKVNIVGANSDTTKKITDILSDCSKKDDVEMRAEEIK